MMFTQWVVIQYHFKFTRMQINNNINDANFLVQLLISGDDGNVKMDSVYVKYY